MKRRFLLTVCSIFLTSLFFGQTKAIEDPFLKDYVSRNWNAESGLPANTITDVMQDKDGYMYFGTYSGLLRFDGVEFLTLNRLYDEHYDFISARTTFQDSRGHIWIGSNDEGLVCIRHNNGEVLKYTVKDGLPNNSIRAICEDKNNFMWIGTASGVICINRNYLLEYLSGFDKIPNDNKFLVYQLYCDTAGRMWIVTHEENGLYCYSGGHFEVSNIIKSIENPVVTHMTQDSSGAFWFGVAPHYVVKVTSDSETVYDVGHGDQKGTSITAIFQDSAKNMWFALDNGITILHDGEFSYLDTGTLLADDSVNDIMEDRENNIWISLDRGGIQKLSHGRFQTTHTPTTVNAIAQDKLRDMVWFGCDDGLYCYKNNKFVTNEITEFCRNARIRHVGVTEDGAVLVSAYEKIGQVKFNLDGSVEQWKKENGLAGDRVRVAIQTKNKDLYVGTTSGLSHIKAGSGEIINYYKGEQILNDFIMALYENDDGSIWFGTDGGGVYVLKDGEIVKSYTKDTGLVGNIVFKISSVREGEIWVCTGSGLSIINKETGATFNFDMANGFGADGVFQVLQDYTQKIWGTNNKGIFNVSLSEMDEVMNGTRAAVSLAYFSKLDGINSGGVTSTSVSMKDDKGRLWFTLIDGFALMDPVKKGTINYAPTVKVQTVSLDNEKQNILSDGGAFGNKIVVAPNVKRVNIKYTGISHVSSELVRFKTMLEGFDEDFSDWTTERTASFTNLTPGQYVFHVIAQNADGVQSETESKLIIVKKAYLWQKIWFKILLILLIIGVVTLFIYLRFAAYKKRQEEIEKLSIEVTTALSQTIDAKDKYTKGHSNRVAKYSRMLAQALGEDEKTQENIYYVALLHDIGKIGVPNAIINKPGKLTDEEYEIIKTHPVIGADILKTISSMPEISIGARSHHERYDGRGYPDGLAGENIPWIARIIGVADAYDAMTSNRSYRQYLPQDVVRAEIVKCRGVQFAPKVADAMIKLIDEDTQYVMHE
jgi:putative nucleotidyltransferase with HDIG domain